MLISFRGWDVRETCRRQGWRTLIQAPALLGSVTNDRTRLESRSTLEYKKPRPKPEHFYMAAHR